MGPIDPRLIRRCAPVRRQLAVSVCAGGLEAFALVAQAWLFAYVVARGFHRDGLSTAIVTAVLALAAVLVGRALLAWLVELVGARAATRVKSQLRRDVVASLLDERDGRSSDTGGTIALLGSGLDALDPYIARYLPQVALACAVPAIVVVALGWADLLSGAIVLITLPLVVVFMVLIGKLTQERTERRWLALKRLAHHFADVLAGLNVLTVYGRARGQARGLREVGERHRRQTIAALRLAFLSALALELISTISVALVAVSVGLRVVDGRMGLQTALFVLLLAPEAYLPIRKLGAQFHDSAAGAEAASEALALIGDPVDRASDIAGTPDPANEAIVLDGVRVQYPGRDTPALDVGQLRIEPGQTVAIVGPSGGGKSTLVRVLLGLTRPSSGRVLIGTRELSEVEPADWQRRLAWVPQNPALFAGTIASNVRLGVPGASDAQVSAALSRAGAAALHPDRVVLDGGRGLSAGEVRRVALARALLRVEDGASLLILDEPTAGLDASTETTVVESLRSTGVGCVVVAHRPALIAAADRIVEIGRVAVAA